MKLVVEEFNYLDSAALFARVADQNWAIFLDSGIIDGRPPVTKHADFDVLAVDPVATLVTGSKETLVTTNNGSHVSSDDPLLVLEEALTNFGMTAEQVDFGDLQVPAYLPGSLGYFSYDMARHYENLEELTLDVEQLPAMAMGIYSVIVLVDHRRKKTLLISTGEESDTEQRVIHWRLLIQNQLEHSDGAAALSEGYKNRLNCEELNENLTRQEYQSCFDKIRQYTIDGDCYQVNFAKQFSSKVSGDSWQSYAYLRELSPAPYGAYMNLPFAQVLSNSPESFIQCRNRQVVTSPIKGTRPRHKNRQRDAKIADELFNSAKDRAENLMIVDLMRNDLGTCCELGSVKVPKLFTVHSFANVHHLISTVTGIMRPGVHSLDLLRHCFPGGSITGAPKIRAMQIIEELEPNQRGLYCGAIGYVGLDGSLETNIAIRTIVVKDGTARFSAGGGLVIDSDEEEEYQELIDKAKMMIKALFD